MLYIGVDPGKTGGVAALTEEGSVFRVEKMPDLEAELYHLLCALSAAAQPKIARAVLEHVSAWPKMGAVSAFTFGRGYGALHMALITVGIPYQVVTAQTWQAALSCRSKRDKNITKRRAQQLFPRVTVTHAIADALLMAEYCRRFERGLIQRPRGSK